MYRNDAREILTAIPRSNDRASDNITFFWTTPPRSRVVVDDVMRRWGDFRRRCHSTMPSKHINSGSVLGRRMCFCYETLS